MKDQRCSAGRTILGTANRGPFTAKVGHGESRSLPTDLLEGVKNGMSELGLSALVSIGGDGSLSIAQQFHEYGIPIIGIPKTIDNDLEGTLWTFGFDSAVACATDALDRLHTTAESHARVMVLEVMGRYAGWISILSGVAGGADVILIPEIPFNYESICGKIKEREASGKRFTIIVAAEGAREAGGAFVTAADAPTNREARLGGVGAVVAKEIENRTGKEARACVLGRLQRGGGPTPFDRALCSVFGAHAVELVAAEAYGQMVAYLGSHVTGIPIQDAVGKLKTVPPTGSLAQTARALGICFGD
ncbi:6-phosphofructokinase 1 [Pirellulimonas nuda]|uniref:6-phosphofructokinase n=1 Tax=Pirellulimonas nuda TaxID=2528009 RepID=A0A518DC35_9BACT|nr:ATP-dependent 6-phosphofructokinase [Pirellulimonas nuda]QDU89023.1 6-phosphofructokinase 1 [Pirellulimonas nuda]